LGAAARVAALVGDHAAAGPSESGARQRPGQVPLVCRADHILVAFLRALAPSARPPHGASRGLPPVRGFFDLFEILGPIILFFSERSYPRGKRLAWCSAPRAVMRRPGRLLGNLPEEGCFWPAVGVNCCSACRAWRNPTH